jgi:hypothetical protein
MRHLTPEQLVDLAEDSAADPSRPAPSSPHLQSCDTCRATLAELRRTLLAAREVDVPEPSPLFWEHLSARVRDAVEAERAGGSGMLGWWPSWRRVWVGPLWIGSLAAIMLAVAIMTRGPGSERPAPTATVAVIAEPQAGMPPIADDASFSLVADLAADLDWDTAVAAGFATDPGVADDLVAQLTVDERRELHRLLEEMSN